MGKLIDKEGNIYKTVVIGSQEWMAENLHASVYRNGNAIQNISDIHQWSNLTAGAWCNYLNGDGFGDIYGKLYNWYAANNKHGLAPEGWHIPSNEEWDILINYLGGGSLVGPKMKHTGEEHWRDRDEGITNSHATNESGFSAIPGGYPGRQINGYFSNGYHLYGGWWSRTKTEAGSSAAWGYGLCYSPQEIQRSAFDKKCGLYIRCIKDQ